MSVSKCIDCINGKSMPLTTDILCKHHGVVTSSYVCSKFRASPYPSVQPLPRKCSSCSYFILVNEEDKLSAPLGSCRLFSVRNYDGSQKKACSRYTSKV